jgi:hypothetical protein
MTAVPVPAYLALLGSGLVHIFFSSLELTTFPCFIQTNCIILALGLVINQLVAPHIKTGGYPFAEDGPPVVYKVD